MAAAVASVLSMAVMVGGGAQRKSASFFRKGSQITTGGAYEYESGVDTSGKQGTAEHIC